MLSEFMSDLRYRARALFRRAEVEAELEAELRYHVEREAEELERQGLPREEALRRARIAFGREDRIKEESRAVRGTMLLETTLQDLRYALRGLRAQPAFTAGVVLTLALGIGANTAMFGILDRLFFRPPMYLRDSSRVHRVYMARTVDRQDIVVDWTSVARFLDLRRTTHGFSEVVGFNTWRMPVGEGERTREFPAAAVSAEYFGLFDARPVLGRFFTPDEDRMPTGTPVVVLGYGYWQSVLGGRRDVLGGTLRIGRMLFTIIGVAPKGFVGLDEDEVPAMYLPLTAAAWDLRPEDHTHDYHWGWLSIAVKRAPGTGTAAADAGLKRAFQLSQLSERPGDETWARKVAAERPHIVLGPVQAERGPNPRPEAKVAAWVAGVALIVLLIACANVANLMLARALRRRREIALRLALGVSRGRLLRQLLTESAVLSALGAIVALAVARWGGSAIRALFLPGDLAAGGLMDRRTLLATLFVTILVAIGTGLAPLPQALDGSLAGSVTAGGRATSWRSSGLRAALLLFQATLSVVLLVGAGLFVRSLVRVEHFHLGYDVDPVVTLTENMRGVTLEKAQRSGLEARLAEEAEALPGVVAATPAPSVPFWGFEGRYLFVAGIDSVDLLGDFFMQAGNPDYFRVMGTRILRGRGFDATDRAGAPRVTVVSAGMARALWPAQDPIGQCLRINEATAPCTTVVGVAEDLHMRSLTEAREFSYYVPIAQYDDTVAGMLLVRVAGDAGSAAAAVRRRLQHLMPGAAYLTAAPLRDIVAPKMRSWRFGASMFVAFGLLALVLAALGLYSVIAYGVAERRREIGVRIALGAPRAHVLALVVGRGVRLVLLGTGLGCVIALLAGRWLGPLLFQESARDPVVYGSVAGILLLVAWAATAVPAYGAARLDPTIVLRGE